MLPTLVLLSAACTSTTEDSKGPVEVDPPALDIRTTLATIPTVVRVTWTGETDAHVRVEYGADTGYGRVAEPATDTPGTALLVGNLPEADLHFRLVGEDETGTWHTDDMTVPTGALPDGLPTFTPLADVDSTWTSTVLVPVFDMLSGTTELLLLDRDAQVVWSYAVNGAVQSVRLGADGQLVYLVEGEKDGAANTLYAVTWEGGPSTELLVAPMAHHDFVVHQDGGVTLIESEIQTWEGDDVVGDRIVEYAPDGTSRMVWSAWDTMTPSFNQGGAVETPQGLDWTHCNGLDYDATSGRYLVSSFWLKAIFAIDADDGAVAWQLGGEGSDFVFQDDPGFGPQHAPVFVDGGVLLYDNHDPGGPQDPLTASRAVRYELDDFSGQAAPVWEYTPDASLHDGILGDVQALSDGTVFVSSGKGGRLMAVHPGGEVVYAARGPDTIALGRGVVFGPDLAPMW